MRSEKKMNGDQIELNHTGLICRLDHLTIKDSSLFAPYIPIVIHLFIHPFTHSSNRYLLSTSFVRL